MNAATQRPRGRSRAANLRLPHLACR